MVKYYLSSADVLIVTSHSEGSPNIVKGALACNCPVVSTDVGDVSELVNKIEGSYISNSNPEDFATHIKKSFNIGKSFRSRLFIWRRTSL